MKKIIITSLFLLILSQISSPVLAEEASSSTTQNLKERIEKIVGEKKDQIQGVISELSENKRGFIGQVSRVTEETITLTTNKGTEIISLDEDVSIRKANKTIKISEIAVDDWVIVTGIIENDAFQAEKIIVSTTSLSPAPQVVIIANVSQVSKTSLEVNPYNEESKETFIIDKNTIIEDSSGQEQEISDLEEEIKVLVVATENAKGKLLKRIRILN